MTISNIFKIFATIIFANYLDSRINVFMVDYYLSFSLGFLVFCFWAFSLPNNIYALTSFIIGLLVDLISGSPFGLNALLFTVSSFMIHTYRYSFRIFSHGFGSVCLIPRLILFFSLSISKTFTRILKPTSKILFGWIFFLVQLISLE